jgi:chromosome segregation ATPase
MSKETPLSVTVDELRRGLRVFRAFENAEATITALQAAEQRTVDTQRAIETLQADLAKVTDEVSQATAARDAAQTAAKKLLADAAEQRDEILAKAKDDATDVTAKAKAKADERLDKAEDKAKAAEAKAAEAEERCAAATAELAEIESKLEAAKAQIAKLLG